VNGLLLVNLGTPDAPDAPAVRRYLAEFLSDPHVIDVNALSRWLLLHLVILPRRPAQSAAAYQKIWNERGSPLLYHSQDLAAAVAARLGPEWRVELGMRYGRPDLASAVQRLRDAGVERLVAFPLYPQHADSSTGSTLDALRTLAPDAVAVPAFYEHPAFLGAFAGIARRALDELRPDYVLFSFHGLPERQIRKGDPTGAHCLASATCCDAISEPNRLCYRAHSFATARGLARELALEPGSWSVSFQSRLTRAWITPFTDHVIPELARAGKRRLAVMCPAFVADCLETLEEIGIRARELFLAAGGEELGLVPSLNSEPAWVDAVCRIVGETLSSPS
jgi:protoporphyrin/coproporphyrin ferrochelatase